MQIATCFLLLVLALPILTATLVSTQNTVQETQGFANQESERFALYETIQIVYADLAIEGGAQEMQRDIPDLNLRIYVITKPETITGQAYNVVRIWATARPLNPNSQILTNNNLSATTYYDPILKIASKVRYIEKQRSQ
jgi:hypothetical protein